MGTKGTIRLNRVWKMLNACAPGYKRELKLHHYWIRYNGRTFRNLPKGPNQGGGRPPEIRQEHVESMIDHLGLDLAEARKVIKSL